MIIGTLMLSLGGAVSAARAENDKAETLIRQALDLRRAGDDQGAHRLLREAHELAPTPRAAAQLGFCEQALGSWIEAESHYEEALRASDDAWVKKNRGPIEQGLMKTKAHIARLVVTGDPPGAEVLVNGNVVGSLPIGEMVPVPAGDIEIELRARGYAGVTKKMRVEGNQTHRIRLHAERADTDRAEDKSRAALSTSPPAAAAGQGGAATLSAAQQPSTSPSNSSSSAGGDPQVVVGSEPSHPDLAVSSAGVRRSLKFVSWGVAVVGLGVGVYGAISNSSLVNEFDTGCGLDRMGVPRVSMGAPVGYSDNRCADLKHRYEQASTVGIVGFVVGGALAAAGFVLWAVEPSRPQLQLAGATSHWACAPALLGPASPQVTCALRF